MKPLRPTGRVTRRLIACITAALMPAWAGAYSTTYVDAGYVTNSFLVLDFDTNSVAFDNAFNLYTQSTADNGTGTVHILEFTAASGYTAQSTFSTFATTSRSVNGLDFHGSELYASQSDDSGNSGQITLVGNNTSTRVLSLPDFRPTGIDTRGDILFTARKESAGSFGTVYSYDGTSMSQLLGGALTMPLRGIATDAAGNLFVSTRANNFTHDSVSFLGNSIYQLLEADNYSAASAVRLVTFGNGDGSAELATGPDGTLYALVNTREIISISAVPEPHGYALLLAGIGLIGLTGLRKRRTDRDRRLA